METQHKLPVGTKDYSNNSNILHCQIKISSAVTHKTTLLTPSFTFSNQ